MNCFSLSLSSIRSKLVNATAASAVAMSGLIMASAAIAAPTADLIYGRTSVALSKEFVGALTSLKVTPARVYPASLRDGVAAFPIAQGELDASNAKGEISHVGGLSLTAGETRVELTSFTIDTTGATPRLTGLVKANDSIVARIPLFDLKLPALTLPLALPRFSVLNIPGVEVTLTEEAAGALNGVFKVTAFTKGIPIGTAGVSTYALVGGVEGHGKSAVGADAQAKTSSKDKDREQMMNELERSVE